MTSRITSSVIESYLDCPYKGYLTLTGQHGHQSEYEAMILESRAKVHDAAIDKIISRQSAADVTRNTSVTTATPPPVCDVR